MSYWEDRQRQLNKQLEQDEARLNERLSSFYDTEYAKLEKEIASYYQKYGEDNVIQYRVLMEQLSDGDRRLLVEQMERFAEKYPQYAYLMPVRESIYRLNRLEGLQYSIRMQQLGIGAVNNEQIKKHLERNAMRGVNAAAEAMGFGKNFYANNPGITKLFVGVAWSNGKNFSQRIWGNADKLANYLNTDIAQGIARGDSYDRLVRQIKQRFSHVTRSDAYRLIYTEGTYVMAESTMQPFEEDFEEYRISTVGDGRVCPICRGVAEKVFRIKDREPGTNFPPLHPRCRCTFAIEVDDWDKWMEEYEKKHGEGQAKKIAKRFGHDIMELTRKTSDSRKEFKFISDDMFNNLTIAARKKGAVIMRGTEDIEKHLDCMNAAASNLGEILFFRKDVCISEVLEETYHFEQNLSKMNDDREEPLRSILNEIDAKQYLLDNAEKFRIPRNEIELTKKQLKAYQKELEKFYGEQREE